MDAALLGLPVLALVDSTSFGTLLIPLWLMTGQQVLVRQHLLYLGIVGLCYWVLGLALAFGLAAVWADLRALLDTTPALAVQLAVGLALLVAALLPRRFRPGRPGRLARWRDEQFRDGASTRPLVLLALVAVGVEAATMLPYLAAVALIASADLSSGATALLLLGYCLVMLLPALVLLAVRRLAARRVEPVLQRLERWTARSGGEATLWAAGVLGVLVAGDAAGGLGLLGG